MSKEWNNQLNQMNIYSLKCIIQELYDPQIYPNDKFPFFRFFIIPKYHNKEYLIEQFNLIYQNKQKYPILQNYLNDKGEIEALKNIIKINPFVNSIKIKIKENLNKFNPLLFKLFKDFQKGLINIINFFQKKEHKQNKYNSLIKLKYIKDIDSISIILNDDKELLSRLYQQFINWQNSFLYNVIINLYNNDDLFLFKKELENEIYIENAKISNIVNFNLTNLNSLYNNFDEIIIAFSRRNCFDDEGKINYSNYQTIDYDYNLIENEIGKIILPRKKMFKSNYHNLNKYNDDNYKNPSMIEDFILKYGNNSLSKDEQNILLEYTNQNDIDFYLFIQSLQLIIFYIINKNYQNDFSVHRVIDNIPDFFQINDNCKTFFLKYHNFKLNQLISIFEYFEIKCFPQIIKNINEKYKKRIDKIDIDKINNYFKNEKLKLINKTILLTSVKKFILRYLTEKNEENEMKENENLLYLLQIKKEFWDKDIINNSKYNEEFNQMINSFEVKTNEAISFYRILKGDIKLLEDRYDEIN